jgi:hypothetical protein
MPVERVAAHDLAQVAHSDAQTRQGVLGVAPIRLQVEADGVSALIGTDKMELKKKGYVGVAYLYDPVARYSDASHITRGAASG